MDLKEIQQRFNEHYNFPKLKQYILNSTKELTNDWENNCLQELKDELSDDITFKELEIEYSYTQLIINDNSRKSPIFRVCVDLNKPNDNITIFRYEVEYDINGDICDDYFYKI